MRATPHASNASCSSKLLLNINTITRRGRVRPSTRVRASRRARPRAWCLHPLQACAAYPYARVYAMRRDFVWILSKGKGTPTPAQAGSAHAHGHTPTARPAHTTGRARCGGCPQPHTTAEARSPQHTAQQLTHTLTPTRQAAPAATTSTAATRRLLVTRRALHRPAT